MGLCPQQTLDFPQVAFYFGVTMISKEIEKRFWDKVDKRGRNECWEWTAYKSRGYGTLSTKRGKSPVKAHRFSYELHYKKIPDGMVICHKCDNPSCVNPYHLFLGTQADNIKDASKKGRMSRPLPKLRGEGNGSSKLTRLEVKEIRKMHENGIRNVDIAPFFGVTPSAISKIVTNVNWSK